LPVAVVALVVGHVLLVRKHGVVPPFPLAEKDAPETPMPSPDGPAATPIGTQESRT